MSNDEWDNSRHLAKSYPEENHPLGPTLGSGRCLSEAFINGWAVNKVAFKDKPENIYVKHERNLDLKLYV